MLLLSVHLLFTQVKPINGRSGIQALFSGRSKSASAMKTAGGRATFSFTMNLKESGTFFVAAGQLRNGRLSRQHYGVTQVTGKRGETISGMVNSPGFSSGKWAIGAYRTIGNVELA